MPELVGTPVGPIGLGLMGFTWRATSSPDEQAFAAMKAALANNANFWNSGEFYGMSKPPIDNLELLARYFTKYPEDASKVVLSVKGGADLATMMPDGSAAGVRKSVDNVLRTLNGKKSLDIFECARVDPKVPVEETIKTLAEYVKAGKIRGIGLSEVSAATIRRAHAVHPIAAVEVEVSLFATEALENGVFATCAELGIPIAAYSPVGRGMLTETVKTREDMAGNIALHMPRFSEENFPINVKLAEKAKAIAAKKGVTVAQLAVAWVLEKGREFGATTIPIPGTTKNERVVENCKAAGVRLQKDEMEEIQAILSSFEIKGGRYPEAHAPLLYA